ncbi:MAG: OmpA family protein [Cyclobacteriaceae bacterium]
MTKTWGLTGLHRWQAADSLVLIRGHVYDSVSHSPEIRPVKAKLIFERMPYGNEIGIISSKDSAGYYEYYLSYNHEYTLNVSAEGHQKNFNQIRPKDIQHSGVITLDIFLQPQLKANQVIRLEKLIFEQGKSAITVSSNQELNRLVSIMKEHPKMQIQLEGHTDWRGSKKLNHKLSQDRVLAVKSYLVNYGVSSKRIKTKAFGGSDPLTREQSLEASEINRRVEVRILKL